MKTVFACLASACLALLLAQMYYAGAMESTLTAQDRLSRHQQAAGPIEELEPELARLFDARGLTQEEAIGVAVYNAVNRGVVNVTSMVRERQSWQMELESEVTGSGVVIDTKGHILTNYHVVEKAKTLQISLYNGVSYHAEIVGTDPASDLALLRIDAPKLVLFPVTIGNSRHLRVGMRVYALGNPFGLERTLTTGVISALDRSLSVDNAPPILSVIQTDAVINPGSSGGPLLDSHGRVVGISTAIRTSTGENSGVGFAIPSNLVLRAIPQLMAQGHVVRPEIGITRIFQTDQGLLVARLKPDGPAEKAGILGPRIKRLRHGPHFIEQIDRAGADVIVAVDDHHVPTLDDFLKRIEDRQAGDQTVVTVMRNSVKLKIPVILGKPDLWTPLKE